MIIKKIKRLKEEGLSIEISKTINGGSFQGGITSEGKPSPEFDEALGDLKNEVIVLCEESAKSNIRISTISLSYHGENQIPATIISFQKTLNSNAVITINTPLQYMEAASDNTPETQIMNARTATLMEIIIEEAEKIRQRIQRTNRPV